MPLIRRNGVFHFRRRWPNKIRHLGAPEFLSVSLRTPVLFEAVKRSADLLSATSGFAGEIARQNGMEPMLSKHPQSGGKCSLLRRLNDLGARVERDFDDPLDAGRDLLRNHEIGHRPPQEREHTFHASMNALEKAA